MNPTVLFVDDEIRVLKSIRAACRTHFNMLFATNGAQALQYIGKKKIDVVVSDERMPKMRGHEVLSEFRRQSPSTMRILLTGFSDNEAIRHCINEAEVFRYLSKPWNNDELIDCIKTAARHKSNSNIAYMPQPSHQTTSAKHVNDRQISQASSSHATPKSILIVDDHPYLVHSIQRIYGDHFDIHAATNLTEAVDVLASSTGVAVMLIDIDMKGSLPVVHQLTTSSPSLVVIALTKNPDTSTAQSLINHGQVFKYLVKPLGHTRTENVIQEALLRHDELLRSPQAYNRIPDPLPEPLPDDSTEQSGILGRLAAFKDRLFR